MHGWVMCMHTYEHKSGLEFFSLTIVVRQSLNGTLQLCRTILAQKLEATSSN